MDKEQKVKPKAAIRVLLAEDHDIVREGTRQLLERDGDFSIVGEAGDGEEAVRLAEALRPDVVVMDVRMPRMGGLEATKRLKSRYPHMKVLILSAYENDEYVLPLLEAGADGYLLKTTKGAELAQAIRTVYAGQTALDPQVASKVVSRLTSRQQGYRAEGMAEALTARELEVIQAAAKGMANKEIAEALCISFYTVQVHLRNIFGKLGVDNRTEAVTYALTQGWIKLK
ncbi:MAG: response regulator transcription factor [Chloroflexota bacterium]